MFHNLFLLFPFSIPAHPLQYSCSPSRCCKWPPSPTTVSAWRSPVWTNPPVPAWSSTLPGDRRSGGTWPTCSSIPEGSTWPSTYLLSWHWGFLWRWFMVSTCLDRFHIKIDSWMGSLFCSLIFKARFLIYLIVDLIHSLWSYNISADQCTLLFKRGSYFELFRFCR